MSAHEEPGSNGGERRQTGDKSVSGQGAWEGRAGAVLEVVGTLSPPVTGASPQDTATPCEKHTSTHTHLYTELTTALFPVAKRRNNPNVHQLVKYIHTMEYYLTIGMKR